MSTRNNEPAFYSETETLELERKVGEQLSGLRDMLDELQRRCTQDANAFATLIGPAGRLEALERDTVTYRTFEVALKRIDALEELRRVSDRMWNATIPDPMSRVRALDPEEGWERERRADWKATYNAAWPALAQKYETWQLIFADPNLVPAGNDSHDENVRARLEWLHLAASNIADRAHGPLEIVVPAGTKFDEAAFAKGGKLVSGPGWSQWDAKVEALVKAATGMQLAAAEMLRAPTEESSRDWLSACVDSMTRCLKPFETERSE